MMKFNEMQQRVLQAAVVPSQSSAFVSAIETVAAKVKVSSPEFADAIRPVLLVSKTRPWATPQFLAKALSALANSPEPEAAASFSAAEIEKVVGDELRALSEKLKGIQLDAIAQKFHVEQISLDVEWDGERLRILPRVVVSEGLPEWIRQVVGQTTGTPREGEYRLVRLTTKGGRIFESWDQLKEAVGITHHVNPRQILTHMSKHYDSWLPVTALYDMDLPRTLVAYARRHPNRLRLESNSEPEPEASESES